MNLLTQIIFICSMSFQYEYESKSICIDQFLTCTKAKNFNKCVAEQRNRELQDYCAIPFNKIKDFCEEREVKKVPRLSKRKSSSQEL